MPVSAVALRSPVVPDLPRLVVGIDPDSTCSALAWAVLRDGVYVFDGVDGGGTRRVGWGTITGALAWQRFHRARLAIEPSELHVVVETQAANGPHSADVEALRRVRYHWDAACEIEGSVCEHVDPVVWLDEFLRGEPVGRGKGARKDAYQRRAKALTSLAVNEDRCAAIGVLWWYVVGVLGAELRFDR